MLTGYLLDLSTYALGIAACVEGDDIALVCISEKVLVEGAKWRYTHCTYYLYTYITGGFIGRWRLVLVSDILITFLEFSYYNQPLHHVLVFVFLVMKVTARTVIIIIQGYNVV